jgi:hypothetical protein
MGVGPDGQPLKPGKDDDDEPEDGEKAKGKKPFPPKK